MNIIRPSKGTESLSCNKNHIIASNTVGRKQVHESPSDIVSFRGTEKKDIKTREKFTYPSYDGIYGVIDCRNIVAYGDAKIDKIISSGKTTMLKKYTVTLQNDTWTGEVVANGKMELTNKAHLDKGYSENNIKMLDDSTAGQLTTNAEAKFYNKAHVDNVDALITVFENESSAGTIKANYNLSDRPACTLKHKVKADQVIAPDGIVELSDHVNVGEIDARSVKITGEVKADRIKAKDNIVIEGKKGSALIGDITIDSDKETTVLLKGKVKIQGQIRFINVPGRVIAEKDSGGHMPEFDEDQVIGGGSLMDVKLKGFSKVAGMSDVKYYLREHVARPIKEPELRKYRPLPKGVLLYGPNGVGKTHVASALAEDIGCNFMFITPSIITNPNLGYSVENFSKDVKSIIEIIEPFLPEGKKVYTETTKKAANIFDHSDNSAEQSHGCVKKIQDIFKSAAKHAPTIMVLDEFDAIATMDSDGTDGHSIKAEEIKELLTQLDRCSEKNIFVIATTNEPEKIYKPLLRSGRFDRKFLVSLPDEEARVESFKIHLKNKLTDRAIDINEAARFTQGFSHADIEALVSDASTRADIESSPIKTEHLKKAADEIRKAIIVANEEKYKDINWNVD